MTACQWPLSKSSLLVNGKTTCSRLVVKIMTACQSKDHLSRSRLLVNVHLSKARLLVQFPSQGCLSVATCQLLSVTTCPSQSIITNGSICSILRLLYRDMGR